MRQRLKKRRIVIWVIGAVLLLILSVIWHKLIHDYFLPKNFGVVKESHIYRSGRNKPRMLRQIAKEYNLRTIIDLASDSTNPETLEQRRVAEEMGIKRYEFALPGDGTGSINKWAAVLSIMANEAEHPILVHCASGAQRSSTAVILYRHLIEGIPIREAYPESFQNNHKPHKWKLLAFLADHIGQIERAFRTDKPEGEIPADTITKYASSFLISKGPQSGGPPQ